MADSFSKKENFKKKLQKQKEKAARREERKDSNDKGKTLDDMIMYVDANGQFTSTPPVRTEDGDFDMDSIQLGAAPIEAEELIKKGNRVAYEVEKSPKGLSAVDIKVVK